MTNLFESYNRNTNYVSTEQLVLITEVQNDQYVGHNKEQVKVVVDIDSVDPSISYESILGNWVIVNINECSKWHIKGTYVKSINKDQLKEYKNI